MKVVIVTGESPRHKHLCATLARSHNVAGIIHPQKAAGGGKKKLAKVMKRFRDAGAVYTTLNLLSKLPARISGWDSRSEDRRAEAAVFPDAEAEYAKLDLRIIHRGIAVNKEGIGLLKELRPDVVACFGGPVYSKAFIEACPIVLNYHSGISPIYNGASSAKFAFANGHPHLCGGTLMKMSCVVDGGDLLGHYLPVIDSADTPATLFMKTARGAAMLYHNFLEHLRQNGSRWTGFAQGRPLFYYKSADWTVYHGRMVRARMNSGITEKFQRGERAVEYWRQPDPDSARRAFESTITGLLLTST